MYVVQEDWLVTHPRVVWLKDYAELVAHRQVKGNVAECGVFRGAYAQYINRFFPEQELYLFDTFSGFEKMDLESEPTEIEYIDYDYNTTDFTGTSSDFVLSRMPFPDQCIIKKGHFPQTAVDVDDIFCFVSLDMDLYQPILHGLQFFWRRMVRTGIILIHDYYSTRFTNVKKAVQDFEKELGETLRLFPIGDSHSIALIK